MLLVVFKTTCISIGLCLIITCTHSFLKWPHFVILDKLTKVFNKSRKYKVIIKTKHVPLRSTCCCLYAFCNDYFFGRLEMCIFPQKSVLYRRKRWYQKRHHCHHWVLNMASFLWIQLFFKQECIAFLVNCTQRLVSVFNLNIIIINSNRWLSSHHFQISIGEYFDLRHEL